MHLESAITLSHISKTYRCYRRPRDMLAQLIAGRRKQYYHRVQALEDISFSIRKGESIGILGRNGSGKSTLLQIICGTLQPSSGSFAVTGRISALLELGAGFNPEFSGHENIRLNAAILGLSEAEIDQRYEQITRFSGLTEDQLIQPVKTYSSGMYVRLAFSVAVFVEPDILVIDEALAVGDAGFQRKCFAYLQALRERGVTILFVSHSVESVLELCDRACLLDNGVLLSDGTPKTVVNHYQQLIYSPPDQRPAIREAILAGKPPPELTQQSGEAEGEQNNHERMEYGPNGGYISDITLTDLQDKPLSVLQVGQRYRLHYRIHAEETLEQPKFGMLIKTRRGLQIGGGVAEHMALARQSLQPGDTRNLCFEFDCPLQPDTYFLNCGFTCQHEGEPVFIHRIVDALSFKVNAAASELRTIVPAGLINLNLRITGLE